MSHDKEILSALRKHRGRPTSDEEAGYLVNTGRLGDAVHDVVVLGVPEDDVARELAGALAARAKKKRKREAVSVLSRAPAPSPLMALSLLSAIEADDRLDVRSFRRKWNLPAGLPRWVVASDERFGRGRMMVESDPDGGDWYGRSWERLMRDWKGRLPDGCVDELRELSETLADHYSWQEVAAAEYVLTGAAPLLPSIVTTGRLSPRRPAASTYITLECSPITQPREVMAAYAAARRHVLGPRHRPLSEKHLVLAAFGTMERAVTPKPKWKSVLAKWNAEYPEWSYSNAPQFARDWRVAHQRIMVEPDL